MIIRLKVLFKAALFYIDCHLITAIVSTYCSLRHFGAINSPKLLYGNAIDPNSFYPLNMYTSMNDFLKYCLVAFGFIVF